MLTTAAAEGIARECSDTASYRGGDNGWAILVAEEKDGRVRNGSVGQRKKGVGASDNSGNTAREPNAGVSATTRGNRWVNDNSGRGGGNNKGWAVLVRSATTAGNDNKGKKRKKMRAMVGVQRDSTMDAERECGKEEVVTAWVRAAGSNSKIGVTVGKTTMTKAR
ncbi:hypothetical protein B296_00007699 [Ensete ventricosum]|uniref:Uncharacterized protein n=1 Tax=Ensete ventricosum TaxID=4639 RepID=A0A426ZMJ7_ENSVE|nr:hypothetical protein B296_00007699 [Ensete ventricosum]